VSKLTFEQLVHLKVILSVEFLGPVKIRSLLSKFKTLENILKADKISISETEGIGPILAKRIKDVSRKMNEMEKSVSEELEKVKKNNIKILTVWDEEYPQILKKIYDPPLLLYIKGEIKKEDLLSIAIVGTRNISNYGRIQTERITKELVDQGITIVSGVARGVDSTAHKITIQNNGRTIGVIACGINKVYPPENKLLYQQISENGALISEHPLDTLADPRFFPQRNRIISGLSLGTVVIESGIEGGAIQTAHYALEQGREVFAVPGNLEIKQSEGTNRLIQKGEAKLITNAEDILVELNLILKPKNFSKNQKQPEGLSLFEEKIFNILNNQQKHIDLISKESGLTTSECLVHLLGLEFKGLIKQFPGMNFSIS
jgi:DNA processing protein